MKVKDLQWKRALRTALFILLLIVAGLTKSYAYNFTSVAPSGQTLYYTITNDSEHTVMVTHPNNNTDPYWGSYYIGDVIIYQNNPYFNWYSYSGNTHFYYYAKPSGNLIIPYYVQYNGISYSVTAIDDYAFGTTYSSSYACTGLTSVVIPSSVHTIGNQAFAYCTGITSITIPTSVTAMGVDVFRNCSNLETVNFNAANCSSVGVNTWSGCSSFTTLNLGNMVTQIPENGFRGASGITSITIPNSVTYIGDHAFDGCTMLQSTFAAQLLPNALESIGDYAFQNADSLSYIHIPNTVTSIGKYAFQGCTALNTVDFDATNCIYSGTEAEPPFFYCSTLASVTVGNNVTRIPAYCFKDCYSLTTLNLGSGLEEIETYGFFGCLSIDSLVIPASIENIGSFAFGNWYEVQLGYVESKNPIPPVIGGAMAFPTDQTIYVPAISLAIYEEAEYWNEYNLVGSETNYYEITATASPASGGIVSSIGIYEEGQTCTLAATANEGYTFVNWTEDGEEVFTEATYSFVVTADRELIANFEETLTTVEQAFQLIAGWNWFSTNVEITLDDLKAALMEAVPGTNITIKSRTQNIAYNPGTNQWRGTLDSLDVTQMYMISVSADCEISLTGLPINPTEHPVTIHNGINWMAFPLSECMSVSEAFAGFAMDGDIIKSRMNNASYNNGEWRGGLNTLVPGQGYMYKSNATESRTFTFSSAK